MKTRYQQARDRIDSGYEAFQRAICGLSVGDVDPHMRSEALRDLDGIRAGLMRGIKRREQEAIADEVWSGLTPDQREAMKATIRHDR